MSENFSLGVLIFQALNTFKKTLTDSPSKIEIPLGQSHWPGMYF